MQLRSAKDETWLNLWRLKRQYWLDLSDMSLLSAAANLGKEPNTLGCTSSPVHRCGANKVPIVVVRGSEAEENCQPVGADA